MSIDLSQFKQTFLEESEEGLDILESGLLALESGTHDDETIHAVFRAAHSIKGGAGTFSLTAIAEFTHVMETLLDEMRDGRRPITSQAISVLLSSVDVLREMLDAARDEADPDMDRVNAAQQALETELSGEPSQADSTSQPDATASQAKPMGWQIYFKPLEHMLRTGNDPVRMLRELCTLGEYEVVAITDDVPDFFELDPENSYLAWQITLTGDIDKQQVTEIFEWVEDDCELSIEPIHDASAVSPDSSQTTVAEPSAETQPSQPAAEPQAASQQAAQPAKTGASTKKAERKKGGEAQGSIRVGTDKIDTLINMVGELVITQSMLSQLSEDFTMKDLDKMREGLAQLERNTRELQENVMQIRMLPISFTFSRFPRLVHDLSRNLGKKIELKMTGESTEVDKTVIEKIGDPLVHLVRNSVDHGIEMPAVRAANGKPETGTVELNAYHKGGNIIIEIKDDGAGLNGETLFNKAVDKGLISPDAHLSEKQIFELIFMPGFSTAQEITDVSGRGVGMDVVRKNIMALGGGIDIQSELGVGTTFTIRLPLTLAIMDGQSMVVGDEFYIVPLVSILESIQVTPDQINLVAGKGETFKLRDKYLPIIRMADVFDVPGAQNRELSEGLLVVVEGDGRQCGLFVDDLLGQQQLVIKSLEANFRKVDGISGATILGDGSVALILDIPGLIRMVNETVH